MYTHTTHAQKPKPAAALFNELQGPGRIAQQYRPGIHRAAVFVTYS
jgi:hypothetical protein